MCHSGQKRMCFPIFLGKKMISAHSEICRNFDLFVSDLSVMCFQAFLTCERGCSWECSMRGCGPFTFRAPWNFKGMKVEVWRWGFSVFYLCTHGCDRCVSVLLICVSMCVGGWVCLWRSDVFICVYMHVGRCVSMGSSSVCTCVLVGGFL